MCNSPCCWKLWVTPRTRTPIMELMDSLVFSCLYLKAKINYVFQLSSQVTAKCLIMFSGSLQCIKKKIDRFPNQCYYQYKRLIYKNVNIYNLIQLYFLLLHHRLKDILKIKNTKTWKPQNKLDSPYLFPRKGPDHTSTTHGRGPNTASMCWQVTSLFSQIFTKYMQWF